MLHYEVTGEGPAVEVGFGAGEAAGLGVPAEQAPGRAEQAAEQARPWPSRPDLRLPHRHPPVTLPDTFPITVPPPLADRGGFGFCYLGVGGRADAKTMGRIAMTEGRVAIVAASRASPVDRLYTS